MKPSFVTNFIHLINFYSSFYGPFFFLTSLQEGQNQDPFGALVILAHG